VLVAGKSKKNRERVVVFKNFIEAVKEIIYKAVNFIIELTPYAVLSLVASSADKAVSKGGLLWSLLVLLVISFVAFIIDTWGVNAVLLKVFADISPLKFFKKIVPAQVVAFSTQSSVGTLPVSTKIMKERIGVGSEIVDFTLPLGTTIGMPGCAGIWPALVAVYGIHGLNIQYSVGDYLMLIVICLFVSLGTAGVPGTATITTTSVLTALGLPLELIVLTIPITAIADTGRTACNVTGAMVAATIVGHEEGELDEAILLTKHGKFEAEIDGDSDDDENDENGSLESLEGLEPDEPVEDEYEVPTGSCSI
jgi:Na+/H+-dicarboxylate symporter